MDVEVKAEVIKRFINGTTHKMLTRGLNITKEEAYKILWSNETTAEMLRKYIDDHKQGKYVSFLTDALRDVGRPKLPENKKRKIRQIRISDDELEEMGNPNSTRMRALMLQMSKIIKLCEELDEKGIKLIPDEWLETDYKRDDPFWEWLIFSTNENRLTSLAGNEKCISAITKQTDG